MSKQIVQTDKAPAPIGPYNQAIRANGFLFVSGQVAIVPETGALETGKISRPYSKKRNWIFPISLKPPFSSVI
jgi:Endoribonuclease L-PSP